jgi:hypothetical protein
VILWIQEGGVERPGSPIEVAHNFCRNPDESEGIWCSIVDPRDPTKVQKGMCKPLPAATVVPYPTPLPCRFDTTGPGPRGANVTKCTHSRWQPGSKDFCDPLRRSEFQDLLDVDFKNGNSPAAYAQHGERCSALCE